MNHALSRLKRASAVSGPSQASTSKPGAGVDGNGRILPAYNDGNHQPRTMAEKTLPLGAVPYSHPTTQWDQAQRERDELERALKLSEEQDQYEAALRASHEAEERESARKQKELEDEDAILRQSQADHEAHEDKLAIIQAEEEQAILEAIRASEREAARKTAAKGKQTERSPRSQRAIDIDDPPVSGSSSSRIDTDTDSQRTNSIATVQEDEDDEEVRKALELSILDQEDERRQQEELLQTAQQKRNSTASIRDHASTSSTHHNGSLSPSSSASTVARPTPPHLLPPRPGRAAPPPPDQAVAPELPVRRRLSEDEEYASIIDAPPPAYEPSSTAPGTSLQIPAQTSPAPSTEAGTFHSALSSTETAREEARALEDKRQVFYPPVATSEMAEGSMRAFVPHMLFAARRRERSDPDEWFPMASRDVDLAQLPAQPRSPPSPSDLASPASQAPPTSRARRPLPALPVHPESNIPAPQPSALSQLDQKVAAISPTSTATPSYYSASINPSSASIMAPSTTRAVENEDYEDDPFDDSQAALSDSEHHGQNDDSDDYYNDQPSQTIQSPVEQARVTSGSQEHNREDSTEVEEEHHTETTPPVARYDYARTHSRENITHLPPAHSPEPIQGRDRVNAEQQDLANGEGYMSGESALSWESTGSEGEEPSTRRTGSRPIDESAHDINTNISFGFNPLSSPNQHLDWQGRFPDLIVLSRFTDSDPRIESSNEGNSGSNKSKDDYRTFAFEAPTWRELLAYLMWHGNSIFEAASRDKETSPPESLKVSLILEFVKTSIPPSTLVRLQIHLLSTGMGSSTGGAAGSEASNSGARGVALSRQPLSSRPSNYVRSSLPWQQPGSTDLTHLVLAFPKPYHTLPFSLSTIGTHLHNAHKAAVAQHTQQADHRIRLGDKNRFNNTQFLADLLRGIEVCSDRSLDTNSGRQQGKAASPGQGTEARQVSVDDSRFERMVGRLREKRYSMRGTLRELHKSSRIKRRKRKQAKENGKGSLEGRGEDSDESYLESQPQAEDYHITPYRVNV